MLKRIKLIILPLMITLLLMCCATTVFAIFPLLPITEAMIQARDELRASGKISNDFLDCGIMDLSSAPSGTVTSYVYTGNDESLTVNTFDVAPTDILVAADKITRFVFHLTNQYRPETEISISFSLPDCETVTTYTYGEQKHEAMLAIISGIPDCLANPRLGDDDSSDGNSGIPAKQTEPEWAEKYSPEKMIFTTFKIGEKTYTAPDGTVKKMDVEPILRDNRTFVPVRYLAYAIGADDESIIWDEKAQTVTLAFEDSTLILQVGSKIMMVNDEPVEMDVAPFNSEGRIFLPARWIVEPLEIQVEWDEESQEVFIFIEIEGKEEDSQGQD